MDQLLFRDEVLPSDERLRLGQVLLIPPLPPLLLPALTVALGVALACVLVLCQYTRHMTVQGVIAPASGVVKLYASQAGRLQSLKVHEGERVARGQVLMVLDTERQNLQGAPVEREIALRLVQRLEKLRLDLDSTRKFQVAEMTGLQRALDSQTNVRNGLRAQIALLQKRGDSASATATRFEDLRKSGFVTEQAAQDKRDDQVEQQVRLQSAQRDLTTSEQEISRLGIELSSTPARQQVARDQIERDIAATESELALQQIDHEWTLTAPCDCVVSSVDISVGQTAAPNFPLVSMVPQEAQLVATLYAPSRSLGFVAPGQAVELKLDAFPYEKFGAVEGAVESIATTPLTGSESAGGTHLALVQTDSPQEPMYSIKVTIPHPVIAAYGKPMPLRPGMQLSADVQLERRRLGEWILLPLFESGRL